MECARHSRAARSSNASIAYAVSEQVAGSSQLEYCSVHSLVEVYLCNRRAAAGGRYYRSPSQLATDQRCASSFKALRSRF